MNNKSRSKDKDEVLMSMVERVLTAMGRLEEKVEQLSVMVEQGRARSSIGSGNAGVHRLWSLTTKQHAALQMLLRGASNQEIADRMGVSVNTAKVYVRSIAAKYGVTTRAQIVIRAKPEFDAIEQETYLSISRGLPKDWDSAFSVPDRWRKLYAED